MRIVVLSDSHGNASLIRKAAQQQPKAELFIFLGDGDQEFRTVLESDPDKEFWCVRGNCDTFSEEESTAVSWAKDVKILYTHGHQWDVKFGIDKLKEEAKKEEAKIVLFGHTHRPYYHYEDGVFYLNPGSIGNPREGIFPTYATIDIQGKNIVCNHVEITRW